MVDDGSTFRGLFEDICKLLKIRFHAAAKRNHRSIEVERFHAFLNRGTTIYTEERGSNACFVEAAMVLAYAWNASPIDGTGIIRSVPAIGRELKFPMDIELGEEPNVEDDDGDRVLDYIRSMGRDIAFVRKILAFMLEEKRILQSERVNERRKRITYKVGDIVMARVAVQSDKSKNKVAKLVYKSKGPYVIVEDTKLGSYMCRKYGRPNGALSKFLTEDLYLLPPLILPCDEVDTPDLRYLNTDFAPNLKHPFHRDFDIEAYNTKWFDDELRGVEQETPSLKEHIGLIQDEIDSSINDSEPIVESTTEEAKEDEETESEHSEEPVQVTEDRTMDDSMLPDNEKVHLHADDRPRTSDDLQMMLAQSVDKLFFVQYVPAGTLRPKWYAIQVNEEASGDTMEGGVYLCEFLQKHTSDDLKSDSRSRWWPEWRELSWNKDKTEFDYGRRVLLSPRTKPSLQEYGKFSDDICLLDEDIYLAGPFDFKKKDSSTPGQSIIPEERWKELNRICEDRSLMPPSIGGRRGRRGQAEVALMRAALQNVDHDEQGKSSLELLERIFTKTGRRGCVHASRIL